MMGYSTITAIQFISIVPHSNMHLPSALTPLLYKICKMLFLKLYYVVLMLHTTQWDFMVFKINY